jgi:surface antigen
MGFVRVSTIAIVSVVALLSLGVPHRASAETPNVTVRLEAIDAVPARAGSARPMPAGSQHAKSRQPEPVKFTFADEDSTWVLPPPTPPEEIIDVVGVLQCVPYARFMSGIGLHGDAWTWWDQAAGIYARGNHPEPGAILSFPGIERMPLGHIAVVTQVLSQRKILIDHANWPNAIVQHGAISRDIQAVDVSPANDWTEVRVQFGEGGPLGSVYPVNGFIYGWTETGVRIATPRFSLDYALWSPAAPSLRMFNSIAYLWALPPAERKKAYAAAGIVPGPAQSGRSGRPALVLGPMEPEFNGSAMGRVLGVNRLDVGPGGKAGFAVNRVVIQ